MIIRQIKARALTPVTGQKTMTTVIKWKILASFSSRRNNNNHILNFPKEINSVSRLMSRYVRLCIRKKNFCIFSKLSIYATLTSRLIVLGYIYQDKCLLFVKKTRFSLCMVFKFGPLDLNKIENKIPFSQISTEFVAFQLR